MSDDPDRATILRLLHDIDKLAVDRKVAPQSQGRPNPQADVSAGIAAMLTAAWQFASNNGDELAARSRFAAMLRRFADDIDPPEQARRVDEPN
jgi:hypothetical protein